MDLQLNISVTKKDTKKSNIAANKRLKEFKFINKPTFSGKTIARKRSVQQNSETLTFGAPQKKQSKLAKSEADTTDELAINLRDLSENKGKYKGKNYQELSDDIQVKQKARSGGWISSLFKNNPEVPRIGQRAVKPLVEKVFTGSIFSDLDLHPHSVANLLQNLGLKELMMVQQKAIPVILQGRDVLIRSQTGSGKTLAYALPIVDGLQAIRPKINRHCGVRAIVVVPTRELAVQTYELFVKLVKPFTWVVPGLLSGGQKRKAEKARLRKGLSILVGTPGRINDHLRHTKSLNFAKTGCLVLDEADRLLDMGYEKDVAAIVKAIEDHKKAATYDPMALVKQTINKKVFTEEETADKTITDDKIDNEPNKIHKLTEVFLGNEKQTVLLSATLTKAVENLAGLTMIDPVFVDTSEGRALVADSLKLLHEGQSESNLGSKKKKVEILEKEDHNSKVTTTHNALEDNKNFRKGLKPFCGSMVPDLFGPMETKVKETIPKDVPNDDSDSDSDYEYFKVQKQCNTNIEEENNEIHVPPDSENTFADAVKTALIEDEYLLPASVNQTFLVIPMKLRLVTLCSLIVEHCILNKKNGKMIVFMATLEMVDYHADLIETVLMGKEPNKAKHDEMKRAKSKERKRTKMKSDKNEDDISSQSDDSEFEIDYDAPAEGGLLPVQLEIFKLHGSMLHEQRMEVFKQFRKAPTGVLICTDVAARGLDVPRVDLVVQYCAPSNATNYVHRVGRTGRAEKVGAAVMILLPSETEFVRYLEQRRIRLRQANEHACLEHLCTLVPGTSSTRAAIAVQARLEHVAHSDRDWLARASRAYTSWVRFYSGYPREVREYLNSRSLHLGHAAKAFALRDTPAALAKRSKNDPLLKKERPTNRLTLQEDEAERRPGFPRAKVAKLGPLHRQCKQSSMHTASEFDSGLPPLDIGKKKKKKHK